MYNKTSVVYLNQKKYLNKEIYLVSNSNSKTQEYFEDTKGVIRIRKSKNRQHNGQKKKYKKTNNDLQNNHIKLKIE